MLPAAGGDGDALHHGGRAHPGAGDSSARPGSLDGCDHGAHQAAQREPARGARASSTRARAGACACAERRVVEDPDEPDLLRIDDRRARSRCCRSASTCASSRRVPSLVYSRPRRACRSQSYTVDLSGGGLLLAGPDTLKVGEEVNFQLSLDARTCCRSRARAWSCASTSVDAARWRSRRSATSTAGGWCASSSSASAPNAAAGWKRRAAMAAEAADARRRRPSGRFRSERSAEPEAAPRRRSRAEQGQEGGQEGQARARQGRRGAPATGRASPPTRARPARSHARRAGAGWPASCSAATCRCPRSTLVEAGLRALAAGVVCYVAAWAGAVFVWRRLVMLEIKAREQQLLAAARAAADSGEPPAPGARRQASASGGQLGARDEHGPDPSDRLRPAPDPSRRVPPVDAPASGSRASATAAQG